MADGSVVENDSALTLALRRGDFAIIFHWFFRCFLWTSVFGFLLLLAATLPTLHEAAFRIVGLSFIFAAACTVSGWVLGLLFGIPRSLSRPQGGSTPAAAATPATAASPLSSRVNTNLEDISDWLTKTLVGVGLTQLYFVPHYLWEAAAKLNKLGIQWDAGGQILVLALFLYFAPAGFWLGYVGTRTILTRLFDDIERPPAAAIKTSLAPDALKLDPQGKLEPATNPEVRAADAVLLKFPMTALNTPRELAAWGVANARNNNLEGAAVALLEASRAEPSEPAFKQALAKIYTAQDRKDDAQQLLKDDDTSDVAVYNALSEPPPDGFDKAIRIGTRLEQQPGADRNLSLHIWMAAAYGQQSRYATSKEDSALRRQARDRVLAELKAALAIDRDQTRQLLRQAPQRAIYQDLAQLVANDEELAALLA
ncbi:hypothetical protein IP86_14265 [Rhodopseudomonas sp. AAP120]|nr:hypothetical protein IP86_14265 [Rhodopseudomonas sp. AAP120]